MLGVAARSFYRGGFKKVDIQTVPSLYIFLLTMFVVRNPTPSSLTPQNIS
jgi:hypothetical protein